MPMEPKEIKRLIKEKIPDAEITLEDLAGDNDHWVAKAIVSSVFVGKTRVQQHQLVYQALQGRMGGRATCSCSSNLCTRNLKRRRLNKEKIMSENPIFERIQSEIDSADVVLFMKGMLVFPQCGFLRQLFRC